MFDFFYALGPEKLPTPDWCIQYIYDCAKKVSELSAEIPDDMQANSLVQKIPKIFGFVRKGWNSFESLRRDNKDTAILNAYEALVFEEGLPKAKSSKTTLGRDEFERRSELSKGVITKSGYSHGQT